MSDFKANNENNQHLTVKETANYLSRSETTIYTMLKDGMLPGVKLGGKWLINKSKLDEQLSDMLEEKNRLNK